MNVENIADKKNQLRKTINKTLSDFHANLTESQKFHISESLFNKVTALQKYKESKILFAYIPNKFEADCIPIILDALKNEKKVCVPKVNLCALKEGRSEMDFYYLIPPNSSSDNAKKNLENQLETGAYGIKEPKSTLKKFTFTHQNKDFDSSLPAQDEIFMLVPGLAFSRERKRLGHGKGFYDIYIEKMKQNNLKPFLCGFSLSCQIIKDIPTDKNDILMDTVITN